ncbi:hypothetical protein [Sporosarcina koreensis]|uniref:hypothetical protein n=1 Tax=Sporosarcina koreensis TaxID=334735 RepID=UPI00075AAB53|nr:hypothetical protein [Sporosarcina koreensis]
MSNEKNKIPEVTAEQVANAVVPKPEVKAESESNKAFAVETLYTREEIQASPSAFGVLPEVLAGALSLVEGEKLSRSQVQGAIEQFKKRKV